MFKDIIKLEIKTYDGKNLPSTGSVNSRVKKTKSGQDEWKTNR